MKRDDLARLHHIRNQRKLKALERVAACQAAMQRAEQLLMEAKEAVSLQAATALEKESASLSGMIGETLSYAEICNFQTELAVLAEELEILLAAEKDAGDRRAAAQADLKTASTLFRERHRSVEKLQYLMREEKRKHQGRNLALSEAAEDEFRPRPHILGQGKGPFGLGTGDA
jgi:hypothetical protein